MKSYLNTLVYGIIRTVQGGKTKFNNTQLSMKREASRLELAIGAVEDGDITPVVYIAAENKTGRGHIYGFWIGRSPIHHFVEDGGYDT
jgi:hypothetical protein